MQPVLSASQMRAFERRVIEGERVAELLLMENAGAAAAAHLLRQPQRPAAVLVLAGPGNNGGDGFVLARHLRVHGVPTEVAVCVHSSALRGAAAQMWAAFVGTGGVCHEAIGARELGALAGRFELLVDALFGIGLSRPLEGEWVALIDAAAATGLPVLALDIPSGLAADAGHVLGGALPAATTLTFAFPKLGLYTDAGAALCGQKHCLPIGVPPSLTETPSAWLFEEDDARAALGRPLRPAHKGAAGRVLIFGGGEGTLGAARLCAHGALRGGAGLVKIATYPEAARQLQTSTWEVLTHSLDTAAATEIDPLLSWADAVVLGPGLGTGAPAAELVAEVLQRCDKKLIIDADALNISAAQPATLRGPGGSRLCTPHPAEAARLLGSTTEWVQLDRFAALSRLQRELGTSVLLKGVHTLVGSPAFDDGRPRINTTGNSLLATGGSGDVLAGLIAALACHRPLADAACLGAWLHGAAADALLAQEGAHCGQLAREVADYLPQTLTHYAKPA